jgi:hypothetical protein
MLYRITFTDVVFEPAIRVGNLVAMIIIDMIDRRCFRIINDLGAVAGVVPPVKTRLLSFCA